MTFPRLLPSLRQVCLRNEVRVVFPLTFYRHFLSRHATKMFTSWVTLLFLLATLAETSGTQAGEQAIFD